LDGEFVTFICIVRLSSISLIIITVYKQRLALRCKQYCNAELHP
jgi:hypothetical protein